MVKRNLPKKSNKCLLFICSLVRGCGDLVSSGVREGGRGRGGGEEPHLHSGRQRGTCVSPIESGLTSPPPNNTLLEL